jgi:hypothetical protein
MAYTSGIATDYKDLLALMVTFATANGWVVLEQTAERAYLKGTGLAGLDEIYVGVETSENTASGYYNWKLMGSWGWRSGRALTEHPGSMVYGDSINQPNTFADGVFSYLWNHPIPYWMVANGRRIIVVAKVDTVYQTIHLGLLTPPATDAQYPYPLLIGGSGKVATRSYSSSDNAAFWGRYGNSYTASGYNYSFRLSLPGGAWGIGWTNPNMYDVNPQLRPYWGCYPDAQNMLSGIDGSYMLEPIYIISVLPMTATYGAIDGLFFVSGHNNSSENIITVSGVNYLVFHDCARSGYGNLCCMRMA